MVQHYYVCLSNIEMVWLLLDLKAIPNVKD